MIINVNVNALGQRKNKRYIKFSTKEVEIRNYVSLNYKFNGIRLLF